MLLKYLQIILTFFSQAKEIKSVFKGVSTYKIVITSLLLVIGTILYYNKLRPFLESQNIIKRVNVESHEKLDTIVNALKSVEKKMATKNDLDSVQNKLVNYIEKRSAEDNKEMYRTVKNAIKTTDKSGKIEELEEEMEKMDYRLKELDVGSLKENELYYNPLITYRIPIKKDTTIYTNLK